MMRILGHRVARGLLIVLILLFFVVCGVHLTGGHQDRDLLGLALAVTSLLALVLLGDIALISDSFGLSVAGPRALHPRRRSRQAPALLVEPPQPLRC